MPSCKKIMQDREIASEKLKENRNQLNKIYVEKEHLVDKFIREGTDIDEGRGLRLDLYYTYDGIQSAMSDMLFDRDQKQRELAEQMRTEGMGSYIAESQSKKLVFGAIGNVELLKSQVSLRGSLKTMLSAKIRDLVGNNRSMGQG